MPETIDTMSQWEKCRLTLKSRRDVRKKRFVIVTWDPQSIEADWNMQTGKPRTAQPPIAVSPFIRQEFSAYQEQRDLYLARIRNYTLPYGEKSSKTQSGSCIEILDDIDAKVRHCQIRIDRQLMELNLEKKKLSGNLQTETGRIPEEQRQMYRNRMNQMERDCCRNVAEAYLGMSELLSQGLKVLNQTELSLRAIRAHWFHRIRFYYAKAGCCSSKIPPVRLTDELLESLGSAYTVPEYSERCSRFRDQLQQVDEQIRTLEQRIIGTEQDPFPGTDSNILG